MKDLRVNTAKPPFSGTEFAGSRLTGHGVSTMVRRARDMVDFFRDEDALRAMAPDTAIYHVDSFLPVEPGTEGGLFFGITHLHAGSVGDEFFMTKGHFHRRSDRTEYYWGIAGHGVLVLMDRDRSCRTEEVRPGSLHFIPADTAHRLVNVGETILDVGACWPADAGHEYGSIAEAGFGVAVVGAADGFSVVPR